MGHVEQYVRARAYCSANPAFAQSAQFLGHVRAYARAYWSVNHH